MVYQTLSIHLPDCGSTLTGVISIGSSIKWFVSLFVHASTISTSVFTNELQNCSAAHLDFWYSSWNASVVAQHIWHTKFGNGSDSDICVYVWKERDNANDQMLFVGVNKIGFSYFAFEMLIDYVANLCFNSEITEYVQEIIIVCKAQSAFWCTGHSNWLAFDFFFFYLRKFCSMFWV